MAITLNGTTGITTPSDTTPIVNSTTTLQLQTGGTTALTVDASQNVSVGNGTPYAKLNIYGGSLVSGASSYAMFMSGNLTTGRTGTYQANTLGSIHTFYDDASLEFSAGSSSTYISGISVTGNNASLYQGTVRVLTAGAERMRIDASGNVGIGTAISGGNTNGFVFLKNWYGGGDDALIIGHINGTSSGSPYLAFNYNGSQIGSITQAGTTAVLYNTTSDYRLKTNVTPIQNALSTVEALNPVSFTWVDGRKDDGFLAHEIQAIIPNCVTGEKDAVELVDDFDEDGKKIGTKEVPKYQKMDNSGVIPFLVKAIQEQQSLIANLTERIAALEGK